MPYSFFRAEVGEGNVAEVTSTGDTIEGDFKKETAPPKGVDGSPSTHFKTERPAFADDGLIDLLLQKNVVINAHPIDEGQPLWETLLFGFGPTILIVGLFVLLARRAQAAAGGGGLGGFGRSRAKRYDAEQTKESVDFGDVARLTRPRTSWSGGRPAQPRPLHEARCERARRLALGPPGTG